jgi:peptide/nickel transport system permease protein
VKTKVWVLKDLRPVRQVDRARRHQAARVLKNPLALVGLMIVAANVVLMLVGPILAPHDPLTVDFSLKLNAPSPLHPFGTDWLGRDILSRILFGLQISLVNALGVVGIAVLVGVIVGATAGLLGGLILAIPALILALAVAVTLGPGLRSAMFAVAAVWWPWYARLVRGQILAVSQQPYVEAARSIGGSRLHILLRHLLPNCLPPLVVMASLDMGFAILTTAGLSFLGVGAQPPTPELGAMINLGREYLLDFWWVPTIPGIFISLLVLGFNLLGDALRDLMDPQLRGA